MSVNDWMLNRYKSLETVCGIWVPSRYADVVRAAISMLIICVALLGTAWLVVNLFSAR